MSASEFPPQGHSQQPTQHRNARHPDSAFLKSVGFNPAAAERSAGKPTVASGTTYYVSARAGNDANAGTSPAAPWKTLTKASSVQLRRGDAVLLARGDTWRGQTLWPKGSGTAEDPIHISAYGQGPRPHIAPGIGKRNYAIHLVNNSGYKITDLELSHTYGGIVTYSHGMYGHRYLWIQNVFFHDITGKDTRFNTPVRTNDPDWWKCGRCYPELDLKFGTGVSLAGKGDGRRTILSDVTIKDSVFLRTDSGVEMTPSGEVNHGMWRNVNISNSKFTKNYRANGIGLMYVTGGTTSHVTVDRAGYQRGMDWGVAALSMVGSRNYTVRNSEFRNTVRATTDIPDGHGFDFESDNRHITLRDSYIHGNDGLAILFNGNNRIWPGQQSDLVVENNLIENNNRTRWKGNKVFNANFVPGWRADSAGVVRNNTIRLLNNDQAFDTAPVIFAPNNRVYNAAGDLVFSGPKDTTATDDPAFTYDGPPGAQRPWRTVNGSACFWDRSHESAMKGAAYVARFVGRQAVLYAPVGPHHGVAAVSVDGGKEVSIDTYSSHAHCSRPIFTTRKLTNGPHTIRVRVTGHKNEASSRATIGADALAFAR
ncbi:right-handed parallel beta-helix repeat-containing protein [Streptomyces sp. WAC01526]|uniref:right-handed parallel beta-helix repeat-containing protein n=1 Tax=Streptomyces sp. WAC01526 TaxID=2588709 RepID=UPI0011DF16B9|nr:right-handed parallel beta-helix repeat-containing protein [Streptomyces sp. WAC01526]